MVTNYSNKVMDYEYNMFTTAMHVCVSKHLLDEHFTVLWANGYFYELIGYSKEEYEARFHNHVDEYYGNDPDAISEMAGRIVDAYEKKEIGYEFESPMPVNGGGSAWIHITGRFTDEIVDGIPVIYAIYTDVTGQKKLQLELEQRTEELREALREAEQANRAKSDFLSRMSHDIRTPMNAIVGMTQIASTHLDDRDKVSDCLRKIGLSSKHLLGLINDVLDMSKIESGKMTINQDTVFLPEVLDNIVAIIQPSVKERQQRFSVRLHGVKHEYFSSDSLRLRQIFINILSNAVKFTPDGGAVAMEVTEYASDQPGIARFRFEFTDTGIGMKPEFMEHLFDAFTREQDSRVDKTEGSGLGMAITKRIVDMLGGVIVVRSRPGEGSVFNVELPLKISVEPQTVPAELRALNLLVVDDDKIMCEYTMQMLDELGMRGECCNSGADAMRRLRERQKQGVQFDAVILDWRMPERDGLQTAREIRARMGDTLPILIISAYDWGDIMDDAKGVGITGFLTKPVFPSTLLRCIQRYVLHQETNVYGKESDFDFKGKRFLLAEDNKLNREIAVELLTEAGAFVDCAENGAKCTARFEASPERYYDLILMDIRMPVMDGYTATRAVRALTRKDAATVPILAMTADVFEEDVAAAKAAGMNGHLAKPIDILAVKREITRFLCVGGSAAGKSDAR